MSFFLAALLSLFVPFAIAWNWIPVLRMRAPITVVSMLFAILGALELVSRGASALPFVLCVPAAQLVLARAYYLVFARLVGRPPIDSRLRVFSGIDLPVEDLLGGRILYILMLLLALIPVHWVRF